MIDIDVIRHLDKAVEIRQMIDEKHGAGTPEILMSLMLIALDEMWEILNDIRFTMEGK